MEENSPGEMMKIRQCSRCSREIPAGGLAYVFEVKVYADFDGVLLESAADADRELEDLLEEIDLSEAEELEKEVYEEYTLLLCNSCRNRFIEETRPAWEGPFQSQKDPGPFIH
jgi:hypothetical protein